MITKFFDGQDDSNPLNGTTVTDGGQLESILETLTGRDPFICRLEGENGYSLTIGIGPAIGFVQHSPIDGSLPYFVALASDSDLINVEDHVEFLIGGTLTPIPRRNCMPFDVVKQIAVEFVQTGQRSDRVVWEAV